MDRLPTSGQTVVARERHRGSGGKGLNQAVAAAGAGIAVKFIGCVGGDAAGMSLLATLADHAVDCSDVRVDPTMESGMATVFVDGDGANAIIIEAGANGQVGYDDVDAIAFGPDDVLVAQGEIPLAVTERFLVAGRRAGARTILNLAPFTPPSPRLLAATTVLVVNDAELLDLAAWCVGDVDGLDGPGVVQAVSRAPGRRTRCPGADPRLGGSGAGHLQATSWPFPAIGSPSPTPPGPGTRSPECWPPSWPSAPTWPPRW